MEGQRGGSQEGRWGGGFQVGQFGVLGGGLISFDLRADLEAHRPPGGARWLSRQLCISAGHACGAHPATTAGRGGGGGLVAVPRVGGEGVGGGGRATLAGGGGGRRTPSARSRPVTNRGGCGAAHKPLPRGEGRCPRPLRSTLAGLGGGGGRRGRGGGEGLGGLSGRA